MLEHLYKFSKFSWEWQLLIELRSFLANSLEIAIGYQAHDKNNFER